MAVSYGTGKPWKDHSHIAKSSRGSSGSQDSMAKHRGSNRRRPKSEG